MGENIFSYYPSGNIQLTPDEQKWLNSDDSKTFIQEFIGEISRYVISNKTLKNEVTDYVEIFLNTFDGLFEMIFVSTHSLLFGLRALDTEILTKRDEQGKIVTYSLLIHLETGLLGNHNFTDFEISIGELKSLTQILENHLEKITELKKEIDENA